MFTSELNSSQCPYVDIRVQIDLNVHSFLDTIMVEAMFDLLAAKLPQWEFIAGKLVCKDLSKLLQDCNMLVQVGNQATKLSVAEHYQKFSTCINLLDKMPLYPHNLPATYFDTLDKALQAMIKQSHELPNTNSSNMEQPKHLIYCNSHYLSTIKLIRWKLFVEYRCELRVTMVIRISWEAG